MPTGNVVPPPPPPAPKKGWRTATQEMIDKYVPQRRVAAAIFGAGILFLLMAGGFFGLIGWMGSGSSDEAVAARTPRTAEDRLATGHTDRDVPPPDEEDVADPEDPGESDVAVDDEPAEEAPVDDEPAVAVEEADAAPEPNFESADGDVAVAEGEGNAADAAEPVAEAEPEPAAPPPVLPPPPLPAGPADAPPDPPVAVATADAPGPCDGPAALTDQGHLACLGHVLTLARALAPDAAE